MQQDFVDQGWRLRHSLIVSCGSVLGSRQLCRIGSSGNLDGAPPEWIARELSEVCRLPSTQRSR